MAVKVKLQDLPKQFRQRIKQQDRQRTARAKAVVDACKSGDAKRFYDLAYPYDEYPDFWPIALRAIARDISDATPEIQEAFRQVWIETKMLTCGVTCGVNHHHTLCKSFRILMPKYTGAALRLFRGATALERRLAAYGISWTSSLSVAQDFAEGYRAWPGGSVVLEAVAPPEAIIGAMEYAPPLTEAEKAEWELSSNTKVIEYREECEYLVDRRLLGPIKVQRRYAERPLEDAS